jgi:hypothetical protein
MITGYDVATNAGIPAGLIGLILGALIFFIILGIVLWVYMGLTFMAMGRKANLSTPGLAWIPFVGPAIIAFQASKMHWWPWLLLIGIIIPFVGGLFSLAFGIFFVIWQWKLFEAIDKPGWWAILCIISPLNLIFWGIGAWSKD